MRIADGAQWYGKTTTIRAIMGQLSVQSGHIHRFDWLIRIWKVLKLHVLVSAPAGVLIFPNLSVAENLKTFFRLARADSEYEWTVGRVLDLFRAFRNGLSITAIICREVSSDAGHWLPDHQPETVDPR